jgi:hypothetical protein
VKSTLRRLDCTTTMASQLPPSVLDLVRQGFANNLRVPSVLQRISSNVISALTHQFTVTYVLVNVVFASMLFPMLVVLFYFSGPGTRTSPVFICAVGTIFFGALQGITITGTTVRPCPLGSCRTPQGSADDLATYRFGICSICQDFSRTPP